MGLRGIDLRKKETRLRPSVFRVDISWHRETTLQNILSIIDGCLQQLLEVCILRLVMVPSRSPLGNRLGVKK